MKITLPHRDVEPLAAWWLWYLAPEIAEATNCTNAVVYITAWCLLLQKQASRSQLYIARGPLKIAYPLVGFACAERAAGALVGCARPPLLRRVAGPTLAVGF